MDSNGTQFEFRFSVMVVLATPYQILLSVRLHLRTPKYNFNLEIEDALEESNISASAMERFERN